MRSVVRLLAYVPADASNPNNWTSFPHNEKRFDSLKVISGVLGPCVSLRKLSAPGLCRRDRRSRLLVGPWV
jgi:hypothetical protein